ncbi:esterase/lipase family protein [Streptomyces sp. NPDC001380]|uniref:esterase/lipase family protein n=1 Tax=Streptomyces sp. NPDC001380 TaxID=3364566 RepID=UPI00367A3C41
MSAAFRRAAAAARTVGGEAAALAGHLLRYPAGIPQERWQDVPPEAGAPDGPTAALHPSPGPVLLVHGFIDNRSVFTALRRSLERDGGHRVHALNHSPLTEDVRSAAALLGRRVEQVRRLHGCGRIALVGHSLGGLIGRYYVQRLGGDEHVHSLVTLGSPHGGTLAARLPSPLPITRQLRPDSDLIAELREPAPGCRTRFAAFWSDADQVILPSRFARLDHPDLAAENILVPGAGHLALTVHADVASGVGRFLEARLTSDDGSVLTAPPPPDRLSA